MKKEKKSDNADDKTHLLFWFLSSYCFSFISSGCCISVWLRICSDVSHTTSTWSCSNAVGASLSWITFPLHTPGSTSNNRTTPKCTTGDTSSVRWGGSCVPSCSRPWHARRSLLLLFIASFHNLHPSEKYKLRLLTIPKDYQTPTWDFQYFLPWESETWMMYRPEIMHSLQTLCAWTRYMLICKRRTTLVT